MNRPRIIACLSAAMLLLFLLVGCSHTGSGVVSGSGGQTAPVSLTVIDSPPVGVDVISFVISITGAVLQPGNISLVNSTNPIQVDLTNLQTNAAILSTLNVPTGTYTSLTVTLANPQLTIQNNTGVSVGSCLDGSVCVLTPPISPVTVTFNGSPFPVTLTQNTPAGFVVDINLSNVIQADLSVSFGASNSVTVTVLSAVPLTSELEEVDGIKGVVQSVGTNQFVLKVLTGQLLTINVNSSTTFEFPSATCAANNFSCIATGQLLEVDLSLLGNGTFLAKNVEFEDASGQQQLEGTIVSISTTSGTTTIQLVTHDEVPSITGIPVGKPVSVTIKSATTFAIDNGQFTIPGGLTFATNADLMIGQEVAVRVLTPVTLVPTIGFLTDRVTLEPRVFGGTVFLINLGAADFTLNSLSSLFTSAAPTAITQIIVQTTSQTVFLNLTPPSLAGLSNGNLVIVEGWLFKTPAASSPATAAAKKVRRLTLTLGG